MHDRRLFINGLWAAAGVLAILAFVLYRFPSVSVDAFTGGPTADPGDVPDFGTTPTNPNNPNNPPPNDPPPNNLPPNPTTDPNHLADGVHALFIDWSNAACSDAGSRSAALNPNTPWCSPAGLNEMQANQKVNAGDTVYIRRGDYALTDQTPISSRYYHVGLVTTGQPNGRITLRSYPGDTVTIRASSYSFKSALNWNNAGYWTIDGLNFLGYVDGSQGRLYIPKILGIGGGSAIEIKNSSFLYTQGNDDIGYGHRNIPGQEGWGGPLAFSNLGSATIDNVAVSCIDSPSKITGRINTLNQDGLLCDNCRSVTVTNSRFLDCGHVSASFRNSSGITLERNTFNNRLHTSLGFGTIPSNEGTTANNTIRQNRFFGHNQFPSESTLMGGALQLGPGGMSNTKIFNNLFYDGYNDSTAITVSNNLIQYPNTAANDNTQIYHNTIYQAGLRGINLGNNANPGQNGVSNTKIFNNLIIDSRLSDTIVNTNPKYEFSATLYDFLQNNAYGTQIKNNLIHTLRPDGKVAYIQNPNGQGASSYDGAAFEALPFVDNTIVAGPLFASPSAGDFHLQAGSSAINAAVCLPEVGTDFDGRSRSAGGGCTIGALEYDPTVSTQAVCGNSLVETGEQCDRGNLNGQSCRNIGFASGSLSCNSDCSFNFGACLMSVATTTPPLPPPATTTPLRITLPPPRTTPPKVNLPEPKGDNPIASSATSTAAPKLPPCPERWLCRQSWSECVDGKQTRECTELTHLGTTACRPAVERSCVSAPVTAIDDANSPTAPAGPSLAERLNLTPVQAQALAILVPTFFATLAVLATMLIRLFL